LTADTPGVKACEAMGVTATSPPVLPLLFRPERHAAFTPAPNPVFGAGTVRLASGKVLGWVRVPLFSVEAYPAFCAQTWDAFRTRLTGPCDDDQCRGDFQDVVLTSGFVDAFAAQLDAFRAAKVSGVVVDITDNGGGTDWVVDTALLLAASPLSCPAGARVRESAAVESAAKDVKEAESCSAPLPDVAWAKAVQAEIAQPCDWRPVFRTGTAPACSMLTRSRRSTCRPSIGGGLPCAAHKPPPDDRREHGLRGVPLHVLMNRATASASELFAAVLRDNGAATLVGETSLGAGCGYIDGGGEVTLKHSGLKVRMPNCTRYRVDGSNEVEGIAPDVALPWTGEDLARFDSYAEKALTHADELFTRVLAR
jgi:hypothetical protein